jgi:hypothetical protein
MMTPKSGPETDQNGAMPSPGLIKQLKLNEKIFILAHAGNTAPHDRHDLILTVPHDRQHIRV